MERIIIKKKYPTKNLNQQMIASIKIPASTHEQLSELAEKSGWKIYQLANKLLIEAMKRAEIEDDGVDEEWPLE